MAQIKKIVINVLVILLVAGLALLFTIASVAISSPDRASQEIAQAVNVWQQVNSNGYGDPTTGEVTALEAFNGYLYAGTYNPIDPPPGPLYDGAQIFRSSDGGTWTAVTQPGFGNAHDTAPPAILDLASFKGYLYASTGRGNAAQIWRSSDGQNWGRVVNAGFGDPNVVNISVMTVYGNWLYVGATQQDTGAQIWRTFTGDGNLNNWNQVIAGTDPATVTGLTEFSIDGMLYAAIQSETGAPAQIWRSYGGASGSWTTVISDGFGNNANTLTGGMVEFGGSLYVGVGNTGNGAQLWYTSDGDNWYQTTTPGSGDSNNQKVEMVFVFENQLYVSLNNPVTGIEVWRSSNGTIWEQANQDGFGDSNNSGSNWSNATAEFLGNLYLGTSNVADGGELWRLRQSYGVHLSPDQTKQSSAGKTITYTLSITNTGTLTDTFDLAVTGQTWTTTLSTSQVNLVPSASTFFTVTVDIPPGTADNTSDTVTITATSQGDSNKTDTSVLNSTCVLLPVYGLVLSPDDSLSASSGQTVSYTLSITNTGNVNDSFNLTATGQTWTTTLSISQVNLVPSASTLFTVTVAIPPGAVSQATDTVTITAVSQGDNSKTDSSVLTTTVLPVHGVALSADKSLHAPAGQTVTYSLSITNTGNITDNINLTATGQTWTTTLSTSQVNLVPFASTPFTVTVAVPPGATDLDSDTVTITATSQGDSSKTDSALLTSTCISLPVYGVTLSADDSLSAPSGSQVQYILTISNTGNMLDTFDLLPSGNSWATTLSSQVVTLTAGASQTVTITVSIPFASAASASDVVTINATSRHDINKNDTADLTTVSTGLPYSIYLPIIKKDSP